MNREAKRREKKNKALERKRKRNADERAALKRKTDWALQLSLGCTLMTVRDLYPDFELNREFFTRLRENIEQVTYNSRDLDVLFKCIKDEFGFDIRKI